jgi:DNA-binding SARP family transcriptional activator
VAVAVHDQDGWLIQLLGGFELHGPDGVVDATPGVQRLLAFIALQGGAVSRMRAAGELWPAVQAGPASANLRSTLWRARRLGPLVRPGATTLRLGPTVVVDVEQLAHLPHLVASAAEPTQIGGSFNLELLPDWTDAWVTVERERLRHLELHVLDDQVAALVDGGRVAEALDTALRAIRLEPLRETSHQALIRIFLQSGNRSAALTAYQGFVTLLREELDLGPDPVTTELVQPLLSSRQRPVRPWRPGLGPASRRPTGSLRRR